jgi:hypothetical protein
LWEDQDTKEEPKNWQVPEVDFLSNRHPAKSASEEDVEFGDVAITRRLSLAKY